MEGWNVSYIPVTIEVQQAHSLFLAVCHLPLGNLASRLWYTNKGLEELGVDNHNKKACDQSVGSATMITKRVEDRHRDCTVQPLVRRCNTDSLPRGIDDW